MVVDECLEHGRGVVLLIGTLFPQVHSPKFGCGAVSTIETIFQAKKNSMVQHGVSVVASLSICSFMLVAQSPHTSMVSHTCAYRRTGRRVQIMEQQNCDGGILSTKVSLILCRTTSETLSDYGKRQGGRIQWAVGHNGRWGTNSNGHVANALATEQFHHDSGDWCYLFVMVHSSAVQHHRVNHVAGEELADLQGALAQSHTACGGQAKAWGWNAQHA